MIFAFIISGIAMKNLYLLPTESFNPMPYQIWRKKDGGLWRPTKEFPINSSLTGKVNIYITSDEQPKYKDYYTIDGKKIYYCNTLNPKRNNHYKKIILTTDEDLIKDGVQAIDDEFLEWFVKNPSFEYVEAKSIKTIPALQLTGNNHCFYKILIPIKNFYCGDEVDYGEQCDFQCDRCVDAIGVDYGWLSPTRPFKLREEPYTDTQQKSLNLNKELVKQNNLEEIMSEYDELNQEISEGLSPMNDLLQDLKETKLSVKESIDEINDQFFRDQINIFVQKTLDAIILRIESELLEKEVNWQKEQDKNMFNEKELRSIAEASFGFYQTNDFDDNELEEQWKIWLEKRLKQIKSK